MKAIINVCQSHRHSIINGYTFDIVKINNRSVTLSCDDIEMCFSEIMIVDFQRELEVADDETLYKLKGYAIVNNIKIPR